MAFNLSDYVEVKDRIIAFYKDHPEGSLQSEVVTLTDSYVLVKGYAYRSPDDQRPCIGHSGLQIPGSTPYTKGSEVENAETSAWGRALAAMGYEVKKSIASQDEISMKQPRPSVAFIKAANEWLAEHEISWTSDRVAAAFGERITDARARKPVVDAYLERGGNLEKFTQAVEQAKGLPFVEND